MECEIQAENEGVAATCSSFPFTPYAHGPLIEGALPCRALTLLSRTRGDLGTWAGGGVTGGEQENRSGGVGNAGWMPILCFGVLRCNGFLDRVLFI